MDTDIQGPPLPNFAPRLYGIALLVGTIVLVGFWLIWRFTANDYARDTQAWREKLNLIAESRTTEVDHWVESHFRELRELADNPSLQLYLTQLQAMPMEGALAEDEAQKSYLRNLLVFTADRGGYSRSPSSQAIPANLPSGNEGGLAVFNGKNAMVVSTAVAPALRDHMLQWAAQAPPAKEQLIDIFQGDDGKIAIGFVLPVYAIQGERGAGSQIGKVVGITSVDARFFALLKHPGITEQTLESILVRRSGNQIDYLSPLQDNAAALSRKDPADSKNVEAVLINTTGNFSANAKDYRDKSVFATSRLIPNTPWTLVAKIDRKEAMADGFQRRLGLVVVFVLIIAVMVLIIVAVWWQAYSKRSILQSRYFQTLAKQAQAQEKLLRLVTDNQLEPLYIVDKTLTVHFANRRMAEAANMSQKYVPGRVLGDIYGTIRADKIREFCAKSLATHTVLYNVQRSSDTGDEKIIHYAFIPLERIPLTALPDTVPGVLIVEQDITTVVRERERRTATLRQLVRTLIKLVDRRDPYAANHSLLVSELAYQIATALGLDAVMSETTRMAAKLLNIGKIVVPIELLTKTQALTEDEKRSIQASMSSAPQLISHIDFDGPVAETLRQWQERWDGTGPLKLQGNTVLISARILAPANAFIGMISPRSWRDAMTIEAAIQLLMKQAGTHFDRNVVVAMVHYIENHHGKSWIRKVLENNKKAN